MNGLDHAWRWLADEPRQRRGLRALQVCMGCMLLFRVSTEARFAHYLWGPHGIAEGSSRVFFGRQLAPLLDRVYASDAGVFMLVACLGLGALGLVFGYRTRLASAIALVTFMLLEARLTELGDGGDNITRLVLTYSLFTLPAGKEARRRSFAVWFHNLGVLSIGLQIGVLYLTSGFLKATGEKWNNGTAMYLISHVEWFSHPAMRGIFSNPYVTTLSGYATLFFQLWFPIAVLSPLRLLWIAVGIFFHVGIGVFMGLICFSLAMIGLELFLITDAEYLRLSEWISAVGARFAARVRAPAPAVRLFIDGFCPTCLAASRTLERLDLRGRLEVVSFRHDSRFVVHGISLDALEQRMHLVDLPSGEVLGGFAAVERLARVLPLLWPMVPILAAARLIGSGERVYDFLAARRMIIPDARACGLDGCSVARAGAAGGSGQ